MVSPSMSTSIGTGPVALTTVPPVISVVMAGPGPRTRPAGGRGIPDDLALGVGEVGRAVEVVVAEVLDAHPVDGADEVLVRHRGRRLLQSPEIVGQPAAGGRRVEDDLRTVEPQRPPALREVPVVADVDPDAADRGVEGRIAEVAGPEVELLPEAADVRNVRLAV